MYVVTKTMYNSVVDCYRFDNMDDAVEWMDIMRLSLEGKGYLVYSKGNYYVSMKRKDDEAGKSDTSLEVSYAFNGSMFMEREKATNAHFDAPKVGA